MNATCVTVYRGRIEGAEVGPSLTASVCKALGISPDVPGLRLRGFSFVRRAVGAPDVIFELVVRPPVWAMPKRDHSPAP